MIILLKRVDFPARMLSIDRLTPVGSDNSNSICVVGLKGLEKGGYFEVMRNELHKLK